MRFTIYKRGQGKHTRLWSLVGLLTIVALGCWQVFGKLAALAWDSARVGEWVSTMVPLVVFLCLGGVVLWIFNKPVVVDFMIMAEGEVKKVSWSSRKEIAASTFIVIVLMFILAALLGVIDLIFQLLFSAIIP